MKKQIIKTYITSQKLLGKRLLHFIHIGKTAGSAIRGAVAEKAGLSGNLCSAKDYILLMHGHDFKLEDVQEGEFAFFSVRDPLQRFVSGFYSRKRMGRPKNNNPWTKEEAQAFQYFQTPNEVGLSLGGDAKERERACFALENIGHVNSSYWDWFGDAAFLKANKHKILFVLRQENLNADFHMFCRQYAPDLGDLPNDEVKSHKNPDMLDKTLEEQAKTYLKEWYQREYAFLDLLYTEGLIPEKYNHEQPDAI